MNIELLVYVVRTSSKLFEEFKSFLSIFFFFLCRRNKKKHLLTGAKYWAKI